MSALHPRTPAQRIGLWLGLGLFAPARVAALAALLAVRWSTEALPIPATAMLPRAAGPLLGIVPVERAGHGYGSSSGRRSGSPQWWCGWWSFGPN